MYVVYCGVFCRDVGTFITLRNVGGPLGIHVVPDFDENGRLVALLKCTLLVGDKLHE